METIKNLKTVFEVSLDAVSFTIALIVVANLHFGVECLPIEIIDEIGQYLNLIPGFSAGISYLLKKME